MTIPPPLEVFSIAPAPILPRTDPYMVGVYYFPGWSSLDRWKILDPFPERRPLLGYYREGSPEVMDWQIKWAVDHGISFFVFDWYWRKGRRWSDQALHQGYLNSRFRQDVKFAILWANHNPSGSHSEEDLLSVVDFWIDHYFRLPEYLTIDGKPVVIIFAPMRIVSDLGADEARVALEKMRSRAVARGLPGLFLVARVGPNQRRVALLGENGYDALTGYNYSRAGMSDREADREPYDTAIEGYEQIWKTIVGFGVLPYIPVAEPGWDSRPLVRRRELLVRTEKHPSKFEEMLGRARAFVDAHPVQGKKLVLIEAWNEYGEGASVEPHAEFGFGYLDAIRKVFVSDTAAPHAHPVPSESFIRAYQAMPAR